ncbi:MULTISPECIES: peptidylprolyl isomerase [Acidithiobacillus]|nr:MULTISPECIES: peptidylprolyl isomerase [Acidithiobacillus]
MMLDAFRKLSQSWAAKIVLAVIALSFVLWGVSGYLFSNDSGEQVVAKVDGDKISAAIFQQRLHDAREHYAQVFGPEAAAQMAKDPSFAPDVLNGLIDNLLLAHEARKLGLQVPDSALAQKIEGISAFADKGKFSRAKYQEVLRANGLTPVKFEAMLRDSMLLEQLQAVPQILAVASRKDAESAWSWSQEYRDARVVQIPVRSFLKAATPTDAEVQSYYQQHQSDYALPAQVEVQYVTFGPKDFDQSHGSGTAATASASSPAPSQGSPELAFESQIENFKDKLFSDSGSLAGVAKAYGLKIEDSGTLTAGKTPSSGVFADPKALDLAFSKAVLAGKNSSALRLPNGDLLAVHLLHYTPPRSQDLQAVRSEIAATLAERKARRLAKARAQELLDAAEKSRDPKDLDPDGSYPEKRYSDLARHSAAGLDPSLMNAIFLAPAPEGQGAPSFGMVEQKDGYALYAVTRVILPNQALLNPSVTQEIQRSLEEQRARLLTTGYLQALRHKAHIRIHEDVLKHFE